MIIGAAEENCLVIRTAHDMGLVVFVTDGNPNSPGFSMADDFAVASTYDPQRTLKAAKDYIAQGRRIDGVMTVAADVPHTVAYVAEGLQVPGIGVESASNASEKIRMKERFQQHMVPTPSFHEATDERHLIKVAEEFGLPVVVKPVDSRGGRGVQLIRDRAQLPTAYVTARGYSPTGRVMVEEYLIGPQLSTEGFMIDGQAHIPAIFDRNYEYLARFAPFVVENGGEMPSIYSAEFRDEIHAVMQHAALALGVKTSVIKGDLIIHNGLVKVIEVATRLSGGFFGTVATPVSCGVALDRINIKLSLGDRLDPKELEHKFERAAAIRFAFPEPGRVKRITGFNRVLQDSACRYAHIFLKEGDVIPRITNHPARPAVVVAEGDRLQEAIENAKRLINMLQWEIEGV